MALRQAFEVQFVEVHVNGKPVYIRIDEILRFEAVGDEKGRGTKVVLRDGTEIIIDETPEQLKEALNTAIIIRTQTRGIH